MSHRQLEASAEGQAAMKHDAAEQVLSDVLTQYGANACDSATHARNIAA